MTTYSFSEHLFWNPPDNVCYLLFTCQPGHPSIASAHTTPKSTIIAAIGVNDLSSTFSINYVRPAGGGKLIVHWVWVVSLRVSHPFTHATQRYHVLIDRVLRLYADCVSLLTRYTDPERRRNSPQHSAVTEIKMGISSLQAPARLSRTNHVKLLTESSPARRVDVVVCGVCSPE